MKAAACFFDTFSTFVLFKVTECDVLLNVVITVSLLLFYFSCNVFLSLSLSLSLPIFFLFVSFAIIWNIRVAVSLDGLSSILWRLNTGAVSFIVVKVQIESICPKIIFRWIKSLSTALIQTFHIVGNITWTRTKRSIITMDFSIEIAWQKFRAAGHWKETLLFNS